MELHDGRSEDLVSIGEQWREAQLEQATAGGRIPLSHSLPWAELCEGKRQRLLIVRDAGGAVLGSVAVRTTSSRVLPGHQYLRVDRFGDEFPGPALQSAVKALAMLARRNVRVLRLSVRIFSRTRREEAAELLERHGFRRSGQPQSYRHTLTVDLTPDESAILGGFHKTARKNLRSAQQSPLCLRTLTDERYAHRIKELQDESMRRTGKCHNRVNWRSILQLSRACPGLSRIDGLFLSEDDLDPARLVAFGWGSIQGDHGAYCAAGTARLPLLKAPLSYPVLWDLMTWAKRQGASWFDMGGVTLGGSETDPLKGISDFKRYFSRTVEEVSDEWTLELRPLRSRLAAALGNGVHGISEPFTRAGMNRLAKASRTL